MVTDPFSGAAAEMREYLGRVRRLIEKLEQDRDETGLILQGPLGDCYADLIEEELGQARAVERELSGILGE